MPVTPHRILVLANQTACKDELLTLVRERSAARPSAVTLLVPATHAADQLVWTEGGDREIAQRRLDAALERFGSEGIEAEGCVGDANPVLAAADLMIDREFDEIILSTLPPG